MEARLSSENRHDVKPHGELASGTAQEGTRSGDQAPLLRRMDRCLRSAEARPRTGFHLDEDERRPVASDDVDLPPDRSPVAGHDLVSAVAKEPARALLRRLS